MSSLPGAEFNGKQDGTSTLTHPVEGVNVNQNDPLKFRRAVLRAHRRYKEENRTLMRMASNSPREGHVNPLSTVSQSRLMKDPGISPRPDRRYPSVTPLGSVSSLLVKPSGAGTVPPTLVEVGTIDTRVTFEESLGVSHKTIPQESPPGSPGEVSFEMQDHLDIEESRREPPNSPMVPPLVIPIGPIGSSGSPDSTLTKSPNYTDTLTTARLPTNLDNGAAILDHVIQNRDMDAEVDDIIDEMIVNATNRKQYYFNKSDRYKYLDTIIFYLTMIGGIATGILGIFKIAGSDTSAPIYYTIMGIGFGTSAITQIKNKFEFEPRSIILRNCSYEFDRGITKLRALQLSPLDPFETLNKAQSIEEQLNAVDMDAFNSRLLDPKDAHHVMTFTKRDDNAPPPPPSNDSAPPDIEDPTPRTVSQAIMSRSRVSHRDSGLLSRIASGASQKEFGSHRDSGGSGNQHADVIVGKSGNLNSSPPRNYGTGGSIESGGLESPRNNSPNPEPSKRGHFNIFGIFSKDSSSTHVSENKTQEV